MDALVNVCSRNTNVIMVLGMDTRMLKHERYSGLGMDAIVSVCARNTNRYYGFGHGCPGNRTLSKHTNVIMVWAWMHWQPYALGAQRKGGNHEKVCKPLKTSPNRQVMWARVTNYGINGILISGLCLAQTL